MRRLTRLCNSTVHHPAVPHTIQQRPTPSSNAIHHHRRSFAPEASQNMELLNGDLKALFKTSDHPAQLSLPAEKDGSKMKVTAAEAWFARVRQQNGGLLEYGSKMDGCFWVWNG
ncbi:hypothetical protein Pyn_07885 [Prunus yedoensis var. nudiflora]|uniref:Uncharacterized protein n=1 Tax=Prunus yedoensis var. nudiflora TaxID=2094558 RepID=A0A314XRW3_PRUYE|nr:hypothetical protein Pyn_07885 [Prunus yedoensis var. nudiflora]